MPDTISVRVRGASKTKVLINGEADKAIYLNLSDTGILDRLNETHQKLYDEAQNAVELKSEDIEFGDVDDEKTQETLKNLAEIDKKLRDLIDFIFDGNVAAPCSAGGKMYDPVDGYYRFEVIIEDLLSLYGETLPAEFEKIQKKRAERTKKYIKK